jgi:Flp pilus assembly protein CpaB
MEKTTLAMIAIVAALGLIGVLAITIVTIPLQQQAEARGCESGGAPSTAFNASKGRCFGH